MKPPAAIAGLPSPRIVLRQGAYNDEIYTQLRSINPSSIIIEGRAGGKARAGGTSGSPAVRNDEIPDQRRSSSKPNYGIDPSSRNIEGRGRGRAKTGATGHRGWEQSSDASAAERPGPRPGPPAGQSHGASSEPRQLRQQHLKPKAHVTAVLIGGMLNNAVQAHANNMPVLSTLPAFDLYVSISTKACKTKELFKGAAYCGHDVTTLEDFTKRLYGSALRALELVDPPFGHIKAPLGSRAEHDAGIANRIIRWRMANLWALLVKSAPPPGPAAYEWVWWMRPDAFMRPLHSGGFEFLDRIGPRELEVKTVPGCLYRAYHYFNWDVDCMWWGTPASMRVLLDSFEYVQNHTCADVEASCRKHPAQVPEPPPLFRALATPYPPRVCTEPGTGEAGHRCVMTAHLRNHNIIINHTLKDMRAGFRNPCPAKVT